MKAGIVTGQVVEFGDLSRADQDAWRAFLAHRPAAFLSYAYTGAVASCVPLVRVCRIMRDGRTVGFFPFQYRSRAHAAAGIGERLGGDLSDYFGVVAEPGFETTPKALLQISNLKSLVFSHLDETQQEMGLTAGMPEIGHRIDLPDGGEAFWEDKGRTDKKFVSDTERRERKLVREFGPLSFAFSDLDSEQSLNKLIAHKRTQYQATGVRDVLDDERTQTILAALHLTRDEQCSGMVSTLHAGDTWVASHFGLKCGFTLHYWFPVYNPALKAFAPGRILLKQIIAAAHAYGITRIDRGAGDSVAKRDFATSHHFFQSGLWQQPGLAATAHRIGLAIDWRLALYLGRRGAISE